jgi:hypothetical protein
MNPVTSGSTVLLLLQARKGRWQLEQFAGLFSIAIVRINFYLQGVT